MGRVERTGKFTDHKRTYGKGMVQTEQRKRKNILLSSSESQRKTMR